MARLMCPHCGWSYDPTINGEGHDLVPNHWHKAVDCPGQQQRPRDIENDTRPLWIEEDVIRRFLEFQMVPDTRSLSV